jgi:hypothetical protein
MLGEFSDERRPRDWLQLASDLGGPSKRGGELRRMEVAINRLTYRERKWTTF